MSWTVQPQIVWAGPEHAWGVEQAHLDRSPVIHRRRARIVRTWPAFSLSSRTATLKGERETEPIRQFTNCQTLLRKVFGVDTPRDLQCLVTPGRHITSPPGLPPSPHLCVRTRCLELDGSGSIYQCRPRAVILITAIRICRNPRCGPLTYSGDVP